MEETIQVGKPVTGMELIGRETEISLLLQLLSSGQSVVLIAPRRFGKTSVVLETLNRLKSQRKFTAYIDIFSTPTMQYMAEEITAKMLSNKKLDQAFYGFKKSVKNIFKNGTTPSRINK